MRAAARAALAGIAAALAALAAPVSATATDTAPEPSPPAAAPGTVRPAAPADAAGRDPQPDWGLALSEFAAVLLTENLRYWAEYGKWIEDWQYELTWADQRRRVLELEGLRFDSNDFQTNWTHALAGGTYYTLGRVNNLGVGDSFLLAAAASTYWEIFVEWREVMSVNDSVETIFGALSLGEPWYQLARYLGSRPGRGARALAFVHPVLALHSMFDPDSRPRPTPSQDLPGHGVAFGLGGASADSHYDSDDGAFTVLALRSRLALTPRLTEPGRERRWAPDVLSSLFDLTLSFDDRRIGEVDLYSRAVLCGWLDRDVRGDGHGRGATIGLGSAFTLMRKARVESYDSGEPQVRQGYDLGLEQPRNFRDKYALVHLLGPVWEGFRRGPALEAAWSLEAFPDFGQVNAYALNAWSRGRDISGVKTTLLYFGYYYGWGGTVRGTLDVRAGPVTVGLAASLRHHESIEGLDRFEGELPGDVHAADTWARLEARLAAALRGTPFELEAGARWTTRRGRIGGTVERGRESRYSLVLSYRL